MRKAIILVCMLQLVVAGSVLGQATTGSIVGNITDPSGATVADTVVIAENQATGVKYSGKTTTDGEYVLLHLPPGAYTVTVSRDGFETQTIKDVTLAIDQKQLLDFKLKIGSINSITTVTSAPTLLQTQSVETGEVIQTNEILDLPLLGRSFLNLTTLTAGVITTFSNTNAFSISVNGQREYGNSILIDGVEATTNRTQDITVQPGVDSVQEFKITTSAYAAEFGRAAGGIVSIQTKSGGNSFHGDAFEFFRPNFGAARPFAFGPKGPASVLQQHNYGGTLGGPIKKDKSFFFVSYERTKLSNAFTELDSTPPIGQINVLPSGAVDLSHLLDPFPNNGMPTVVPIFDPNTTFPCNGQFSFAPGQTPCPTPQQFAGNIIPANRVSKAGLNTLLNFFATPNLPGTNFGWFNNFQVDSPVTFTGNIGDARFDHNFSNNDRLSVVYHYGDSNQLVTDPYHGATKVPGGGDADQANDEELRNQELSVTETHIFSSKLINEARFGYTRLREDLFSLLNGHDFSTQFGVGNIAVPGFPATDGYPFIFLGSGYLAGGSTFKPFLELDSNYQFSDNLTVSSVGKHEFKFGADFRKLNSNPVFSLFPTGFQFYDSFGSSATSNPNLFANPLPESFSTGGTDIADLLLGIPGSVDIGLQLTHPHTQSWEMAYYAQDTYKFSPKLTLNYGIRYEFYAPYTEVNNGESNYDPATNSFLLAGAGSNSRSLVNSRKNDFGPRLGFAYQINSKTVIRAGYGFYYSPENDGREDILTKNFPFAIQSTFSNSVFVGGPLSYQLDAGVPRVTSPQIPAGATSIPAASIQNGGLEDSFFINPNIKTGYSQSFNLTIQREIGSNFTAEAAYVGSVSHDLSYEIGNINVNGVVTPFLGQIQEITDAGFGRYNSLQLKLTKRVSRNLNFLAVYTYGHNLDNGPAPFDLGHINNDQPQDPRNLRAEYASADDDIRHNFVFSGLYRLPIGQGQAFFGNWGYYHELILGGWQINSIFNAHTGSPINVVSNGGQVACPGVRPNLVSDPNANVPAGDSFNPNAFVSNETGQNSCQFGNAGRNILVGPGLVNVDFSLFKEFRIKEWAKLQTRFEAFNASNTPHFANPNSDLSSPGNLGMITRTNGSNQRVLQLAAKFIF
jgi:hypothetical protein